MLTLIAGALLMAAMSYTGIGVKRVYRIRRDIFVDAEEFSLYLGREIKSMKTPLNQLIPEYAAGKKGEFCKMLKKYMEGLKYGYKSTGDVLNDIKSIYLCASDNLIIAGFLFALGKNDLNTELTNIERNADIFAEKNSKYAEELNKKGNLYYKLFVLLGIALMIIVV